MCLSTSATPSHDDEPALHLCKPTSKVHIYMDGTVCGLGTRLVSSRFCTHYQCHSALISTPYSIPILMHSTYALHCPSTPILQISFITMLIQSAIGPAAESGRKLYTECTKAENKDINDRETTLFP